MICQQAIYIQKRFKRSSFLFIFFIHRFGEMQLFRFSTQWGWLGVASSRWQATTDSAITCTGEVTFYFPFTRINKKYTKSNIELYDFCNRVTMQIAYSYYQCQFCLSVYKINNSIQNYEFEEMKDSILSLYLQGCYAGADHQLRDQYFCRVRDIRYSGLHGTLGRYNSRKSCQSRYQSFFFLYDTNTRYHFQAMYQYLGLEHCVYMCVKVYLKKKFVNIDLKVKYHLSLIYMTYYCFLDSYVNLCLIVQFFTQISVNIFQALV